MTSLATTMFVFYLGAAVIVALALYWVIRLAVRDGILAANRRGARL